tara:strand:- start:8 stop:772 length:765 start_codon:yes stop_codon:yes gene_type:complete
MGIKVKELVYSIIDALSFRISGGTKTLTPHKVDKEITALEGEDGLHLNTGMTLKVQKFKYIINKIEARRNNNVLSYVCSTDKRNKISFYILPMLAERRNMFFWDTLLMNAFVGYADVRDVICVLFRFSGDPLFLKFEQAVTQFSNYKGKVDVDSYHVMFVFDVPSQHKRSWNKLKLGKYSELSRKYKERILDFHGMTKHSSIGQVLYKSAKRRKYLEDLLNAPIDENSELLTAIDFDNDVFDPKVYEFNKSRLI